MFSLARGFAPIVTRTPITSAVVSARLFSSEGKKLFVGGLSWNTDEDTLKQTFSRFGEVADTKIVTDRLSGKSRGFGFVTFNESSDAQSAMENLNHSELNGRSISVNIAQDRVQREGGYNNRREGGSGGGYRDRRSDNRDGEY
eukprot:TRINITY_DN11264_c0_g1_i1.p1 TRINITY_DN11264_c0_g1~~TRINITY_DN11264_c0_g1_i1.p1  ORF type:complete len:143 (+),score=15.87 TRINITY_DN11264_c0_g1_i1:30-458(+)